MASAEAAFMAVSDAGLGCLVNNSRNVAAKQTVRSGAADGGKHSPSDTPMTVLLGAAQR